MLDHLEGQRLEQGTLRLCFFFFSFFFFCLNFFLKSNPFFIVLTEHIQLKEYFVEDRLNLNRPTYCLLFLSRITSSLYCCPYAFFSSNNHLMTNAFCLGVTDFLLLFSKGNSVSL